MTTDWAVLKAEYIASTVSTRELAEKYSISDASVEKECTRSNWVEERRNLSEKVDARVKKQLEKDMSETIFKFNNMSAKLAGLSLNIVGQRLMRNNEELAKPEAERNPEHLLEPKDLASIVKSLSEATKTGRLSTGQSTNNTAAVISDGFETTLSPEEQRLIEAVLQDEC